MEKYMGFSKYMVVILAIYIYVTQYSQNICRKNVFKSDSDRRKCCWFSVSWCERFVVFFFSDFAFKLVTRLCIPTVLLTKVEISLPEEVLSRLNKITGYCRFIEKHSMPPTSYI